MMSTMDKVRYRAYMLARGYTPPPKKAESKTVPEGGTVSKRKSRKKREQD